MGEYLDRQWINGLIYRYTDEWENEWMDGGKDGWMGFNWCYT